MNSAIQSSVLSTLVSDRPARRLGAAAPDVPMVQPLQAPRAPDRAGTGSSFSDDPFARMLESRRESQRQDARAAERQQLERSRLQAGAERKPAPAADETAALSGAAPAALLTAQPAAKQAGAAQPAARDSRAPRLAKDAGADASGDDSGALASSTTRPTADAGASGVQRRWQEGPSRSKEPVRATGAATTDDPDAKAARAEDTGPADAAGSARAQPDSAADEARRQATASAPEASHVATAAQARADSGLPAGTRAVEPVVQADKAAAAGLAENPAAAGRGRADDADLGRGADGSDGSDGVAGPGASSTAAVADTSPAAATGTRESGATASPAPVHPALQTAPQATPDAVPHRAADAAPGTAQASLQPPVGSPAFNGLLASQLTLWVRGGIQQAQLQLNPAAMGPVKVAISLDGNAAQVRLVAEQGSTRQALEQALPTLASHLAEAGLTLAGGGVFQQAPGRQDGDSPSGPPFGSRPRAPVAAEASAQHDQQRTLGMPAPRVRGILDLLA